MNTLKQIRLKKGLSQRDLERLTGIFKSNISKYENHHWNMSVKTAQTFADALGVRLGKLLGDKK